MNELRNAQWSKYIPGLQVVKATYSIVVHGVSKLNVNFENEDTVAYTKSEIEISKLEKIHYQQHHHAPKTCVNCSKEQPAWHYDCPTRTQEIARLEALKQQQQIHYFAL